MAEKKTSNLSDRQDAERSGPGGINPDATSVANQDSTIRDAKYPGEKPHESSVVQVEEIK